ncbi:MAG TPA: winged helix-turn-helix domain-containing protein [Edaphobacter sp.]|nr:winged helix-turn-helix domain-containing protein [Edaphobacter sp.]
MLEGDGRPIALTPKAFEILQVLVQNGNRLTSKEELMRRVWPDSFVEEANLTVNISVLRRQLGEAPDGQQYIETVPTKGYRFAVPVLARPNQIQSEPVRTEERESEQAPASPAALAIAPAAIPAQPEKVRGWKWRSRSGLILLSLLAVLLLGLLYRAHWRKPAQHPIPKLQRRLAVLPFQNIRHDASADFLGFPLADAVITKLGYVSEVSVRPSYAVQKYGSQTIDIPKLAADLNVDTLLIGTFLREGENLRIACQLIDVKTDDILWRGVFDLKYDKLLTVQDEVAQKAVQGLELTLTGSEAGKLRTNPNVSPAAYEYYLRGVDLYAKGDFPLAIKMLEKSTDLAPQFASAWANLGRTYTANASFQVGGRNHYDKAEAAFARALSLQPDEIDARIYMANMFTDTGRVEKAVPLLREALKSNPNHAEVHWELGYAYRFAGMLQESVAECERARQIDPGVKLNSSALNTYLYLGEYDRFLRSLPRTDDVALIVFYRGLGEYYEGNARAAQADFDHSFAMDSSMLQAIVGKAISLGIQHDNSAAAAMLQKLEAKINDRGMVDPEAMYKIAQAYAKIGDRKSAIRWLRRSIEDGFFSYPYFATDPLLIPIRNESEYPLLIEIARKRHDSFNASFF